MPKLRQTPSQTVGPYFAYGLSPEQYGYQQNLTSIAGSEMAAGDVEGQRIRVEGRVFDGVGNPISDALIEIWQADALGRYSHPADPRGSNSAFKGFGRCGTGTDPHSRFIFDTIKPGKVGDNQAPHLNVIVSMPEPVADAPNITHGRPGERISAASRSLMELRLNPAACA